MSYWLRQTLLIAAGGLLLLGLVVFLARRQKITLRYTVGWTLIAVAGLLGAALTQVLQPLTDLFGMSPTGLLLAMASVVLLTITLLLSVSASGLQAQLREVVEANALQSIGATYPPLARPDEPGDQSAGRVLVVVPAWNEQASVGAVVAEVRAAGFDVLVVDDGSADHTAVVARGAGAEVVRLPVNLGVGGAMRCGFRYAVSRGYQCVVQCDADGQHRPAAIPQLLAVMAESGADMVIGSRFHPEAGGYDVGFVRGRVMRLLARSASRATGSPIRDATSGFRAIAEPLLSALAVEFPTHYLGDTYETVTTVGRAGYRVVEVPVEMDRRAHGESSAPPLSAARFTLRALVMVGARLHFQVAPAPERGR